MQVATPCASMDESTAMETCSPLNSPAGCSPIEAKASTTLLSGTFSKPALHRAGWVDFPLVARPVEEFASLPGLAIGAAVSLGHRLAQGTRNAPPTCFDVGHAPNITVCDYAARIERWFQCSGSCFAVSLIYIDRLTQCHPSFIVDSQCCHKLFFTSVVAAVKVHDDHYYSNAFYAKVGGVSLRELNAMEATFLKLLGFSLHVQPQEFSAYRALCTKMGQL